MSLAAVIDRQSSLLEELGVLLQREFDLLMANPVASTALASLASAKEQALAAIEIEDARRRDLLAHAHYDDDPEGMAQAARRAGCLEQWQQLLDRTRGARHLNLLNGSLIGQRMAHNRQILAALQALAGNPLYGVDGQSQRRGGGLNCKA
ncbi:MAG: flagellar protein FlgN [Pseudomonas sp.]